MKIAELLKEAQYSRLEIGNRWLSRSGNNWRVLEVDKKGKIGQVIITTSSEDKAVEELLKGEPLYKDVLKKAIEGSK